ncbi:hypothetical protein DT075_13290 [Bacillus licheniformis]|nr:hypothetical protein DT075_13290 [Bacillus licheniformis]
MKHFIICCISVIFVFFAHFLGISILFHLSGAFYQTVGSLLLFTLCYTGHEPLRFLEIFKDDHYADVSLNQWLALVPEELVRHHLDVGSEFTKMLSKEKHPVVKFDKK